MSLSHSSPTYCCFLEALLPHVLLPLSLELLSLAPPTAPQIQMHCPTIKSTKVLSWPPPKPPPLANPPAPKPSTITPRIPRIHHMIHCMQHPQHWVDIWLLVLVPNLLENSSNSTYASHHPAIDLWLMVALWSCEMDCTNRTEADKKEHKSCCHKLLMTMIQQFTWTSTFLIKWYYYIAPNITLNETSRSHHSNSWFSKSLCFCSISCLTFNRIFSTSCCLSCHIDSIACQPPDSVIP